MRPGRGSVGQHSVLSNTSRGTTFPTQAGSDGSYNLPLLPPGDYDLTVEAAGFERQQVGGLHLTVGQVLPYDVHLTIGSVKSEVQVTAEPPAVQVEQAQQANTVNQQTIEGLPNRFGFYALSIAVVVFGILPFLLIGILKL